MATPLKDGVQIDPAPLLASSSGSPEKAPDQLEPLLKIPHYLSPC